MRFQLIHHLEQIVDQNLLRRSWELCTDRRIEGRYDDVVALSRALTDRAEAARLPPRIKEVMRAAFEFGIAHPEKLDFGAPDASLASCLAVTHATGVARSRMRSSSASCTSRKA